jgi:hypothetical protein
VPAVRISGQIPKLILQSPANKRRMSLSFNLKLNRAVAPRRIEKCR